MVASSTPITESKTQSVWLNASRSLPPVSHTAIKIPPNIRPMQPIIHHMARLCSACRRFSFSCSIPGASLSGAKVCRRIAAHSGHAFSTADILHRFPFFSRKSKVYSCAITKSTSSTLQSSLPNQLYLAFILPSSTCR